MEFTPGILDQILNVIQGGINAALPVLEGDVRFLFQSFLIISIVFSGVAYAFGSLSSGLEFMVKKILLVSGALFLVTNWLDVTAVIVNSFALLGLNAGGAAAEGLTLGAFLSPSSILTMGLDLGDVLFQRATEAGGFTGISIAAVFLFFSGLIVALSFLIIALQVFITLLEFKLVTLGGFLLLPFALLDRTEALAQGALGYVIAAGVKIFTLALVVSFAFAIFPNIPIPEEDALETFTTQLVIMGTALTFVLLALKAPSLASSMISGGPSLGVGALAQSAAAVAGAGAVGYAGIRASGAVGSAAGSVIHKSRQGLQSRTGGGVGGPTIAPSGGFGGGGGPSGGSGTAVALRPGTDLRSPGTAVGPAFGGGSSAGAGGSPSGGGGGPSFDSGGGSSSGGFSSFDGGGGAAAPLDGEGDGRSPGTAGGASTSIADLKAARQSLRRGAIATGAALHGGGGGGGTARIDISSRR